MSSNQKLLLQTGRQSEASKSKRGSPCHQTARGLWTLNLVPTEADVEKISDWSQNSFFPRLPTTLKSEKKVALHGFLQELSGLVSRCSGPPSCKSALGPRTAGTRLFCVLPKKVSCPLGSRREVHRMEGSQCAFLRLQSIWCGFPVTQV